MASIFSKVRTIFLSNVHTVLDKTIDLNSIAAVEQNIRDLEEARKDLEGELAEQQYDLNKKKTDSVAHEARKNELIASIQKLGTTHPSAKALAEDVVRLNDLMTQEQQVIIQITQTVNGLSAAVSKVRAKEADMKSQLGRLKAMDSTAKAQNRAVSAIEAVSSATDTSSIDNIQTKIEHNAARAGAAFDRALNDLPDTSSNTSAEADALLAELAGNGTGKVA